MKIYMKQLASSNKTDVLSAELTMGLNPFFNSIFIMIYFNDCQGPVSTPSTWLTLHWVLVKTILTKFHVNQIKCYTSIKDQVKSALVKEFLFHSTC